VPPPKFLVPPAKSDRMDFVFDRHDYVPDPASAATVQTFREHVCATAAKRGAVVPAAGRLIAKARTASLAINVR